MKKEHADKLFNMGELRIGTLFEFRDQEKYDFSRGDEREGRKEIYEDIEDVTIEDPVKYNPLSPFVQKYIKLESGAKNTTLSNCTVSQSHDSVNCYIYCMSKEFDERFYEDFEADVCIKIKSPHKFIKCLSKNLRSRADFIKISPIQYGERTQRHGEHNEYHASVIKDGSYKHQKEVRSIWVPKDKGSISEIFINVPIKCLNRYCEIFHEK